MKVMSCPDCGRRLSFSSTYYQCSSCNHNAATHFEAFTLFERGQIEMVSKGWRFDESGNQYADFRYADGSIHVLTREDVHPV
jgi:hypothetical protein